jgi:phage gp45-like
MDMSDLIQLTDAEIDLVAGGNISQSNTSTVTQTATATNYGAVSATASGTNSVAAAVGADASNSALVAQVNSVRIRGGETRLRAF